MTAQVVFTSDRFALRRVEFEDLMRLRAHRNRADTRCFLGDDRTISADEQIRWWERKGAESFKIVTRNADNVDVGIIRLTDLELPHACVGADVFAAHRGQGLGHVAFGLACAYAEHLGARRLWLQVFLQNTAAVRIYLAAGFQFPADHKVAEMTRQIPGRPGPSLVHYAYMERKRA